MKICHQKKKKKKDFPQFKGKIKVDKYLKFYPAFHFLNFLGKQTEH